MRNKEKEYRIECDCSSVCHFISFRPWLFDDDEEDKEHYLWCAVIEATRDVGFLHRLKWGLKYILGSNDLNHCEVLFNKEELEGLEEFLRTSISRRDVKVGILPHQEIEKPLEGG